MALKLKSCKSQVLLQHIYRSNFDLIQTLFLIQFVPPNFLTKFFHAILPHNCFTQFSTHVVHLDFKHNFSTHHFKPNLFLQFAQYQVEPFWKYIAMSIIFHMPPWQDIQLMWGLCSISYQREICEADFTFLPSPQVLGTRSSYHNSCLFACLLVLPSPPQIGCVILLSINLRCMRME